MRQALILARGIAPKMAASRIKTVAKLRLTNPGILAPLLLAGCATTPPAIEVRTVTVDRIVAVSCLKASDIPGEPALIGDRLTGDAARDLPTVAASAIRLRAWGRTAVALLGGCVLPE